MKNKRSLIFGIIITGLLLCGMITIFLPYVRVSQGDINQAVKVVFEDADKYLGELNGNMEQEWEETRTGVGAAEELIKLDISDDMQPLKKVKTFVLSLLYVSWALGALALVLSIALKAPWKYIFTLSLSVVAAISMLCIFIFLPNVVKNTVVIGVEEQVTATDTGLEEGIEATEGDGTLDIITGESLRDVVVTWVGEFVRELLNRAVTYGYWLWICCMGLTAVTSAMGLVLDKKRSGASITVLTGAYAGATLEVEAGIMIGRDPKKCQLVIEDGQISREHCHISYNKSTGKYLVIDHSTNGTYYVGGSRLEEKLTTEMDAGTVIQLGRKGARLRLG